MASFFDKIQNWVQTLSPKSKSRSSTSPSPSPNSNSSSTIQMSPLDEPQPPSDWLFPEDCLQWILDQGLRLGEKLGAGAYGSAYTLCSKNEEEPCEKIVKVQRIGIKSGIKRTTFELHMSNFKREVKLNSIASDLGVSPRLHGSFTCHNSNGEYYGVIIMDRWDMTLGKYFRTFNTGLSDDMLKRLDQKVDALHTSGVYHGDLHNENVVVRLSKTQPGVVTDVALIDFGWSATKSHPLYPVSRFRDKQLVPKIATQSNTLSESSSLYDNSSYYMEDYW